MPIVKSDALPQVKDERPRVRLIPTLGKPRTELKAGVARHQAIEEKPVDALRLCIDPHARIEICGAALDEKHDCLRISRRNVATSKYQECCQSKQPTHRSPDRGWRGAPLP